LPAPLPHHALLTVLSLGSGREPDVVFRHSHVQARANIVLASHLFAVAYFFLTLMEPDPENTWIGQGIGPDWPEQSVFLQYVAAMWWSIFVITSIGPAYTSVTTAEQIFSCFYALFGMATLAYTLGTLTLLMVKQSSKTMQYHEDMAALRAYIARTNLPSDLERQLKQQLRVQLQMHKSDTSSFLSSIPNHLRVTVSRQLYLPIVENLDGFRLCSKPFLKQLVSEMDVGDGHAERHCDIRGGRGNSSLHRALRQTRARGRPHCSPSERRFVLPVSRLGVWQDSGDVQCAAAVHSASAGAQPASAPVQVRLLRHCQGLPRRLCRSLFRSQAEHRRLDFSHPHALRARSLAGPGPLTALLEAFGATPEEPAEGTGAGALLESVTVDKGDADQVARVCAAAASGRVDQLLDLLSDTPSLAQCHDYNGRTPLHVAAAHGHVNCINVILLRNGVDVNALDRGGSTPLLEAVKNGHSKAAQALQAAGAALLLKDPLPPSAASLLLLLEKTPPPPRPQPPLPVPALLAPHPKPPARAVAAVWSIWSGCWKQEQT
ncbi:hypothetical protein CLOM_g4568, partial [Closterium sp. NIES-68]